VRIAPVGRKPTEAEAYDIVNDLKDAAIRSGWLKVSIPGASPSLLSNALPMDNAVPKNSVVLAQAGAANGTPPKPDRGSPPESEAADHGSSMAPATDPEQRSADYQGARKKAESMDRRSGFAPLMEPPSNDPEFIKASKAWPGVPVVLPNGEHIEDPKSPTHYVMAPFPKLESVVEAARRARSEIQAVKTTSPTLTPLIAAALYDALHRYVDHYGDFDYQRQPNKDQKGGFVQLPQFRNISNSSANNSSCRVLRHWQFRVFSLSRSQATVVFSIHIFQTETQRNISISAMAWERRAYSI